MPVQVLSFKAYKKNTLEGFCDLKLTNIGLTIKGCTVHRKDGKRWLGLPAKPYDNGSANTTWTNILYFDDDYHKKFQEAALAALDEYLRKPKPEEPMPDDPPF